MRLKGKDAIAYLKANGITISIQHYYKVKGQLEKDKLSRLHEIGKYGFVDQHLNFVDQMLDLFDHNWDFLILQEALQHGVQVSSAEVDFFFPLGIASYARLALIM